MQQTFDITRTSRKMISQFLEGYTLEQLNTIPEGHKNNMIWHIGHVVVTQQLLVYKLSGLPMSISEEMVEKYKKGTSPEHIASQEEVDEIKSLLLETINQTEKDLNDGVFKNYQQYTTSTGFVLNNAVEAMSFNNFHEGIHIGILMGIRKFF